MFKINRTLNEFIDNLFYSESYCEVNTLATIFDKFEGIKHICEYDDFGRCVSEKIYDNNDEIYKKVLEYQEVTESGSIFVSNRILYERIYHNGSLLPTISYTYDLNGNVTNISNNYFGNHQYTYNNLGYLMCDNNINFDYDTNGNIIENGQYIYEYDSSNPERIISCHGAPITYSPDGLYIKDFGLTHYNFEGKRLL